ncbi:MAG: lactate utilization protein [Bacteroidales bacterium]|nr:lactate utilization protein [Bacteroidales bacterium]
MSDKSRQEILNKIAAVRHRRTAAISVQTINNNDIYKPVLPDVLTCFKTELEAISGRCIVCENKSGLIDRLKLFIEEKQLPALYCRDNAIREILTANDIACTNLESDFETMQAGITSCEFLVARTGSVLVTSAGASGRQMNVFPPIHIILANTNQLVDYPEDALKAMAQKYGNQLPSAITTITGPSRTADIEKTLVLGAHGPKELVVFLLKI